MKALEAFKEDFGQNSSNSGRSGKECAVCATVGTAFVKEKVRQLILIGEDADKDC